MVTWFAGLFYLPRLYVYHADTRDEIGHERFVVMEKKLYGIMTIGMAFTWVLGLWLLSYTPSWLAMPWMQAKLALVVLLSAYHIWCGRLRRHFAAQQNQRSATWLRLFNEVPALALVAIVLLVELKPW